MTAAEWLTVAGVISGLTAALPLIRSLATRLDASPEVARKSVHVTMGLACLAFPWIFPRPLPVWVLAGWATLLLAVLRFVPALRSGVGSTLHGIKRLSYGEVLFAPSVAAVFHGADGDALAYVIPIAILTVADAAGALAGTRWGRRRYGCGEGFKTLVGSAWFLATAFLCVFLPLFLSGKTDAVHALWIALILATLAMMAEGISDRGFDNLVVPLGSFFVLQRLLPLDGAALSGRFVVLALLFALVVWGSRWSTLNGASLLAGVLLGYGCAVIADWRFVLPPAAVFVCHVVTTRRHHLTKVFAHRLDVVLSHAIGCMPWVLLAATGVISMDAGLAGISFAMAAQLSMLDASTLSWLGHFSAKPLRSTLKGWLIAGLPGLLWFYPDIGRLRDAAGISIIATIGVTMLLHRLRPGYRDRPTELWVIQGFLALAASLSAFFIQP